MAVYEHAYGPYAGPRTSAWSRFAVIPRHAYQDIFRSKIVTGYFAICFVYPLIASIMVYLHHNSSALAILDLSLADLIAIDAGFFRTYAEVQAVFAFLLTLLVGPSLVSSDLANNALPLYLSRPFSRVEYVVGKLSVLVILASAVTWLPGLVIFALQGYLEGATWFFQNLWIAGAIVVGSWIWILLLALLALAISAVVRRAFAARGALVFLFLAPGAIAAVVNEVFNTRLGSILSLNQLMDSVWVALFQSSARVDVPAPAAFVALGLVYGVCLLLLARRVRAYEVVR